MYSILVGVMEFLAWNDTNVLDLEDSKIRRFEDSRILIL